MYTGLRLWHSQGGKEGHEGVDLISQASWACKCRSHNLHMHRHETFVTATANAPHGVNIATVVKVVIVCCDADFDTRNRVGEIGGSRPPSIVVVPVMKLQK